MANPKRPGRLAATLSGALVAGLCFGWMLVPPAGTERARWWLRHWQESSVDLAACERRVAALGDADWRYLIALGVGRDDWVDRWCQSHPGVLPRCVADWLEARSHANRLNALRVAFWHQRRPFDDARRELLIRAACRPGIEDRDDIVRTAFMDGFPVANSNLLSALTTLAATGDPDARRSIAGILWASHELPGAEARALELSRDPAPAVTDGGQSTTGETGARRPNAVPSARSR